LIRVRYSPRLSQNLRPASPFALDDYLAVPRAPEVHRGCFRLARGMPEFGPHVLLLRAQVKWMPKNFGIPSPIFETLRDSEDTLRAALAELAEDKRQRKPNISQRKLAEYLADQMGYRGVRNVEALLASRARVAESH
jgi:hypothetical protein